MTTPAPRAEKVKTVYAKPKAKENISNEQAVDKLRWAFASKMRMTANAQKKITTEGDRRSAVTKRREGHAAGMTRAQAGGGISDDMTEAEKVEIAELEKYLIKISPFNKRWNVQNTLNKGTYGVAFLGQDNKTGHMGVIKVARGTDEGMRKTAEWESEVLEKIFKKDPAANIVRLLDKGLLQDENGQQLEFMVVEYCSKKVEDYIAEFTNENDRKLRVLNVAMGSLKGLFDLHNMGILHRDVKPDNMGMIDVGDGKHVCVLYDLGMARMFTEADGYLRPPRTTVQFRGTVEWASGHALKGREQTRFDDLIGWFYVIIDLFDPTGNPTPLPWDVIPDNKRGLALLKSVYAPAMILLKHCPSQFYCINTYLMCANRMKCPDYLFIVNQLAAAMEEFKPKTEDAEAVRPMKKAPRKKQALSD